MQLKNTFCITDPVKISLRYVMRVHNDLGGKKHCIENNRRSIIRLTIILLIFHRKRDVEAGKLAMRGCSGVCILFGHFNSDNNIIK